MSNLKLLRHRPDPTIVEMLEELLAKAKKGEVASVAIAVQYRGGNTSSAFHLGLGSDRSQLYFAIDCAKSRLINE